MLYCSSSTLLVLDNGRVVGHPHPGIARCGDGLVGQGHGSHRRLGPLGRLSLKGTGSSRVGTGNRSEYR
jgi:hypothetical protein